MNDQAGSSAVYCAPMRDESRCCKPLLRLFWKELYEVRWGIVAIVLLPPLLAATGDVLTFRGELSSLGSSIWIASGFLLGAFSYSRELMWDTPRFLYSRPVAWWHVWLVKLSVGAVGFLISAVLSAVIYRIVCPTPYLPFASLSALVRGAGVAFLLAFGAFICGFGCSLAMPGFSYSVGISAGLFGLLALAVEFVGIPVNICYAIPLLLSIVSVILARRLTNPTQERVTTFTTIMAPSLVLLLLFALPFSVRSSLASTHMSPDRNFTAAVEWRSDGKALLLRDYTSNKTITVDEGFEIAVLGWAPEPTERQATQRFVYLIQPRAEEAPRIKYVTPATRKANEFGVISLGERPGMWVSHTFGRQPWKWYRAVAQDVSWSPQGNHVVFVLYNQWMDPIVPVGVVEAGWFPRVALDLEHRTNRLIQAPLVGQSWWLSPDEVATQSGGPTGTEIHVVNVVTGAKRVVQLGATGGQ